MMVSEAQRAVQQDPSNGAALGILAGGYALLGEDAKTREWIDRALLVDPDNLNMRYNFACVLIIHLNEIDAALDMLGPIFEKLTPGFLSHARIDPDFAVLRGNPRFEAMMAAAETRIAAERDEQGADA